MHYFNNNWLRLHLIHTLKINEYCVFRVNEIFEFRIYWNRMKHDVLWMSESLEIFFPGSTKIIYVGWWSAMGREKLTFESDWPAALLWDWANDMKTTHIYIVISFIVIHKLVLSPNLCIWRFLVYIHKNILELSFFQYDKLK